MRPAAVAAALPVVPRCFSGETVVCVASGPSLTPDDVTYCRGRARVLVVKDAIRLAPWADVLFGSGADAGHWWKRNGPSLTGFAGARYTLDPAAAEWATVLRHNGPTGLSTDPTTLRTGKNSGYAAINLAALLGAAKIVLLGYDLTPAPDGKDRWFGAHPWQTMPWSVLGQIVAPIYATLVQPLADLGIEIVNASRQTALTCFPRQSITEALA